MHSSTLPHRNFTWYVPLLAMLGLAVAMPSTWSVNIPSPSMILLENLFFWSFMAFSALSSVLAYLNKEPLFRISAAVALSCGVALAVTISLHIGRPPLSGAYESITIMSLVLTFLAWRARSCRISGDLMLPALGFGAAALIMSLLIWAPRQVNPDWFVYQYGWSRAFFLCRNTAMGFLLFSALASLAWPKGELAPARRSRFAARSRRMLLMGTALFLVGEVCGFYWCLTWRGDYWLWNRNFLESTMIFLLASAALHLPPSLAAKTRYLRIAYSVPGLLAAGAYLVHQITEAFLS